MRKWGPSCFAVALVALALGLAACGSSDGGAVVRIGDETISSATVERWTNVARHNRTFPAFRFEPHGTPRQRALIALISAHWLIGEAARMGVPVSQRGIDAELAEHLMGAEYREDLRAAGQNSAGVRLELSAEAALEAIHEEIERRASHVTPAELLSFYRANPNYFGVPETRLVDIVENLPSAAAANALVKRIGTGRRFTAMAYRKEIVLSTGVLSGPVAKKRLDYAIFAAKPGVVSRPMPFNEGWSVFVVRKVTPPRPRPFAQEHELAFLDVRKAKLTAERSSFEREYRNYWQSRTRCSAGYVAPGCAEYRGSTAAHEAPFSADPFV